MQGRVIHNAQYIYIYIYIIHTLHNTYCCADNDLPDYRRWPARSFFFGGGGAKGTR
jgi:hypothetical protein